MKGRPANEPDYSSHSGAALILVIVFSGISICQNLGSRIKVDITDQGIYTLSEGTRAILGKLNQPIKAKLYYTETAAMKAPDQIRYFNNYYEFVKALLREYVAVSKGMVQLEVIDPRPFSQEEEQAMRYGLQRFPITQEENFFFGLVMQTQFGVEKTIPFFSPDRHNFVEYDISYLIDTAITKQKKKIGIMSSLPVMGQDMSDYMARMMQMQGQQPEPPWTIVEQLKNKYEVKTVPTGRERYQRRGHSPGHSPEESAREDAVRDRPVRPQGRARDRLRGPVLLDGPAAAQPDADDPAGPELQPGPAAAELGPADVRQYVCGRPGSGDRGAAEPQSESREGHRLPGIDGGLLQQGQRDLDESQPGSAAVCGCSE